MQGDVDDEAHRPVEARTVRDVKRFGYVNRLLEGELGNLRVRQKRELPIDLMREIRVGRSDAIRDLVRAEDDLVGVGVPEAADTAFERR